MAMVIHTGPLTLSQEFQHLREFYCHYLLPAIAFSSCCTRGCMSRQIVTGCRLQSSPLNTRTQDCIKKIKEK